MIRGDAGFTLVELIVALALFALIGIAGLTLVSGVLDVHRRTEARLDRLADLQRAMLILNSDLVQIGPGDIVETGNGIAFARHAASFGAADRSIAYRTEAGSLERVVDGRVQRILSGTDSVRWSFFEAGKGWRTHWPPSEARADAWPQAIAIDLSLRSSLNQPAGMLRKVILLPDRP